MRRHLLVFSGALSLLTTVAMLLWSTPSSASDPPLSPLAVTFRGQLQTATTMRIFLRTDLEHFPSQFLLHFRADGAATVDGPGNYLRYTWDGTTVWRDQKGGPPPVSVHPELVPLLPVVWRAARSKTTPWLARGPAYALPVARRSASRSSRWT